MGFEEERFNREMQRRIKEKEEWLRSLPDDELMRVDLGIYQTPDKQRDAALMAAAIRQVQRREVSAGWFWRRWRKPAEYQKWLDHRTATEAAAKTNLIDVFRKYRDPQSQEVVRRMEEHQRGVGDSQSTGGSDGVGDDAPP